MGNCQSQLAMSCRWLYKYRVLDIGLTKCFSLFLLLLPKSQVTSLEDIVARHSLGPFMTIVLIKIVQGGRIIPVAPGSTVAVAHHAKFVVEAE